MTSAEERVPALVVRGLSTREIDDRAHISTHTVRERLKALFGKFGVRCRRERVSYLLNQVGSRLALAPAAANPGRTHG